MRGFLLDRGVFPAMARMCFRGCLFARSLLRTASPAAVGLPRHRCRRAMPLCVPQAPHFKHTTKLSPGQSATMTRWPLFSASRSFSTTLGAPTHFLKASLANCFLSTAAARQQRSHLRMLSSPACRHTWPLLGFALFGLLCLGASGGGLASPFGRAGQRRRTTLAVL